MSDSINEQRRPGQGYESGPEEMVVPTAPSGSGPGSDSTNEPHCKHGWGECAECPAAPSVSTDHTNERRAALADLEHVLTLALREIDDEDKAAAVEQFRGDMLALGVHADELDAAGLTEWRDG